MSAEKPTKKQVLQVLEALHRLSPVFESLAMLLYISGLQGDDIDVNAETELMLDTVGVDDAQEPELKAAALRSYQEAVNLTVDRLAPRFDEVAEAQREKGAGNGRIPRPGW